jgi:uncharacterized protein (TIGR00369 family)
MSLTLDFLREITEQHTPFQRHLGIRVTRLEQGIAELVLPFNDNLIGDPLRPALHGGVTATLLDAVGGVAALSTITSLQERLSTLDLSLDYLHPAGPKDLFAGAEVVRRGKSTILVQFRAWQEDPHTIVATGRAVFNIKKVKP